MACSGSTYIGDNRLGLARHRVALKSQPSEVDNVQDQFQADAKETWAEVSLLAAKLAFPNLHLPVYRDHCSVHPVCSIVNRSAPDTRCNEPCLPVHIPCRKCSSAGSQSWQKCFPVAVLCNTCRAYTMQSVER